MMQYDAIAYQNERSVLLQSFQQHLEAIQLIWQPICHVSHSHSPLPPASGRRGRHVASGNACQRRCLVDLRSWWTSRGWFGCETFGRFGQRNERWSREEKDKNIFSTPSGPTSMYLSASAKYSICLGSSATGEVLLPLDALSHLTRSSFRRFSGSD